MTACHRPNILPGPRTLRGQHLPGCNTTPEGPPQPRAYLGRANTFAPEQPVGPDCTGCQPCPHNHCLIDGHTHTDNTHPHTCPTCVGTTRDNLTTVRTLCRRLRNQAANGGHDGHLDASAPIPGREAMHLIGPVSTTGAADPGDHPPPLLTLATWEDVWRDTLNQPDGGRATITSCTDYLHTHLTRMAQRVDVPFDEFAADLAQLRTHLEDVTGAGERHTLEADVTCFECGGTLARLTRDAKPCTCTLTRPHGAHRPGVCCLRCTDDDRHATHDQGGGEDYWTCTNSRCRRRYSDPAYRLACRARADELQPLRTAAQIAELLDVKPGTVRSWATRELLDRRGRDRRGRTLYDVDQARRLHAVHHQAVAS